MFWLLWTKILSKHNFFQIILKFQVIFFKMSYMINLIHCTKNEVFIKYFFSKCDQIHWELRIWWYLLKKSLMKNFILNIQWYLLQHSPGIDKLRGVLRNLWNKKQFTIFSKRSFLDAWKDSEYAYDAAMKKREEIPYITPYITP